MNTVLVVRKKTNEGNSCLRQKRTLKDNSAASYILDPHCARFQAEETNIVKPSNYYYELMEIW